MSTIDPDFRTRTVELDKRKIKLQIWEPASQERFHTITTAYYRGALGIMVIYDITNVTSFHNIEKWIRIAYEHAGANVQRMLVGNNCDKEKARIVKRQQGEMYAASHGIKFMEISAQTGQRVEEAFLTLARDIKDEMDQEMLEKASISTVDNEHHHADLHSAIKTRNHSVTEALIAEKKADVNSMDDDGRTALMLAAEKDDVTSACANPSTCQC